MGKVILMLAAAVLTISGAGFLYVAYEKSQDPCEINQLKMSQTEIQGKDKSGLRLHLDYGFSKKLKKYLPRVKNVKSKVYYKKRFKNRPALVSLVTEFKSKKSAKSAYRYMKRKWEGSAKGEHEVVLDDKTVIWYRNSYSTEQCFHTAVTKSKEILGLDTEEARQVATEKKPKKVKKLRRLKKKRKVSKKKRKKKRSKKLAKGH